MLAISCLLRGQIQLEDFADRAFGLFDQLAAGLLAFLLVVAALVPACQLSQMEAQVVADAFAVADKKAVCGINYMAIMNKCCCDAGIAGKRCMEHCIYFDKNFCFKAFNGSYVKILLAEITKWVMIIENYSDLYALVEKILEKIFMDINNCKLIGLNIAVKAKKARVEASEEDNDGDSD